MLEAKLQGRRALVGSRAYKGSGLNPREATAADRPTTKYSPRQSFTTCLGLSWRSSGKGVWRVRYQVSRADFCAAPSYTQPCARRGPPDPAHLQSPGERQRVPADKSQHVATPNRSTRLFSSSSITESFLWQSGVQTSALLGPNNLRASTARMTHEPNEVEKKNLSNQIATSK